MFITGAGIIFTSLRKIHGEETKTNFEGTYLRDGWVDLTEIWNGMYGVPFRSYRVTDA